MPFKVEMGGIKLRLDFNLTNPAPTTLSTRQAAGEKCKTD
ncbi:uncharacterized protein CTRU02_214116 [Colletotrichum truncatum]|uniref:Uncharacterized protein n=1 Tax=Colletotrichum truncatum TaxID=5467 RepID=A0ACC3YHN0_COLTU|nr:uncharacterized protein CTRU02_06427 [Colletotrichum truncatum]KAF6792931.1 hypothetical protein CTRU02_06427 [Colletotrichum truncatum]